MEMKKTPGVDPYLNFKERKSDLQSCAKIIQTNNFEPIDVTSQALKSRCF